MLEHLPEYQSAACSPGSRTVFSGLGLDMRPMATPATAVEMGTPGHKTSHRSNNTLEWRIKFIDNPKNWICSCSGLKRLF